MKPGNPLISIITIFLLSLSYFAYSQRIDSLYYHSEFEKEAFNNFFDKGIHDYFALYLSADPFIEEKDYEAYNVVYEKAIGELKGLFTKNLKTSKKVKKLYNSIHDNLFEVYDENLTFSNVFKDKDYNCVSGSMIYSLAFEEFNIPYEIHEVPGHVYLNAYPNDINITIETTNPMKGVVIYNNNFKSRFVKYLKDSKQISKEEYSQNTLEQLFNEYFLKPEKITKLNLAGLQYYNLGIIDFEDQKFLKAYFKFEKANFLYQSEKISYLKQLSLLLAIEATDMLENIYAELIAKACKFEGKLINRNNIIATFAEITNRQLIYEGRQDLYNRSYDIIKSAINDSLTKKEVEFIYHLEIGRYLMQKSEIDIALPHLELAYSLKTTNIEAELLFINSLLSTISNSRLDGDYGEDVLKTIQEYSERYPKLNEQLELSKLKSIICLSLMDEYFFQNKVEKALYYQSYFEQNFQDGILSLYEVRMLISKAYSTGAAYYFKIGNTKKSKAILDKGLFYLPDDYQLKRRLKAL